MYTIKGQLTLQQNAMRAVSMFQFPLGKGLVGLELEAAESCCSSSTVA